MKKLLGLLLVLVLVMGTNAVIFAEEADLTLEEEIAVLEQTIADLEDLLLKEGLTEEEINTATTALLDAEIDLQVLNSELEEKVRLEKIASLEAKLIEIKEELTLLESVDTSEFTEGELQSHNDLKDSLTNNYKILSEEYSAFTEEEEIDPVIELENEISLLKEQLLDDSLSEEEKNLIQVALLTLENELEELKNSTEEEKEATKAKLEEDIEALKEMLDDETLTEEEIADIMSKIDALKAELDILEEQSENPNEERFELAKNLDISNGKMNLLQKLKRASDMDDFLFEDWSEKSVKEIMQKIKNYRKNFEEIEAVLSSEEDDIEKVSNGKNNGKAKGRKK